MCFKVFSLIGLCIFFGAEAFATPTPTSLSHPITVENLQTVVKFLSSDALAGRLTGSAGEKLATDYIANKFLQLGLEPAGDNGTFFQEFNFTAGVLLGKNNFFAITNQQGVTRHLVMNKDWRPLAFSDNTVFQNTELVFAGYGITAPASGHLPAYDSYQHLNVKNKWVIVFRYTPEKISDERSRQLSLYASLRYKAFTAKEHGAKGIIFVSGPNAKVTKELIPLSFDTSLSGSGIVAVSVTDEVINDLLLRKLQTVQDEFDSGRLVSLPVIANINIAGQIDIGENIQHGRNVLAKLKCDANWIPRTSRGTTGGRDALVKTMGCHDALAGCRDALAKTMGGRDALAKTTEGRDVVPASMIVVGAHVDHLGHGELSGSRARDDEIGKIHPGADDNASGVASMLAAAEYFSNLKAQGKWHGNKDILFAAWSGEEFGVLGSTHFVTTFMKANASNSLRPAIAAAINLDMVGHLRQQLVLQGTGSSSEWSTLLKKINTQPPLALITQNDPYLPTDSTSFYLHGVPTLNFFTGAHDDYHTPRDTAVSLNYEGIKRVAEFLVNVVLALTDKPNLIAYNDIPKSDINSEREFKIYLGTIPDYSSADVMGVKLSGVAKNSPAAQAGLKAKDVIIELAGKNIHDIYDYTFVLNALHAGKPAKVVVQREQAKIALTVVARYRD
jgi:hypothetical protein